MFHQALEIATACRGWIVGSAASKHLVPDLPVDRIDVLASSYRTPYDADLLEVAHVSSGHVFYRFFELKGTCVNIIKPANGAYDTDPSDVIKIFMRHTDMSINKCYYDSTGAFHSTPAADHAAASRSMHVDRTQLDRVHKYRQRGFAVDCEFISACCVYLPEIRDMIAQTTSIHALILNKMTITDELVATLPQVEDLEFQDCTMLSPTIRVPNVTMSRCVGHARLVGCLDLFTRDDCEFLMIEVPDFIPEEDRERLFAVYTFACTYVDVPQHNWSCTPYTKDSEIDQMLLDLKGMSFMSNHVTPEYAHEIIDTLIADILRATANNRKFCEMEGCAIFYALLRSSYRATAYPRVTVPVEWIHCLGLLMWLAAHGVCALKHQYSTPYVKCMCGDRALQKFGGRICTRLFTFDIPTFVNACLPQHVKLFQDATFHNCHVVRSSDGAITYHVVALDTDGIRDLIEQHGITPEIRDFLDEQLKIDHLHDHALSKMLCL